MSAARQVPLRGLAAGTAVALALGAYSVLHEPTRRDFVLYGFESAASWKSALTLVVAVLFVAQAALGFKLAGMLGFRVPTRAGLAELRRLVATLAVGFSVPVAFHCVWVLGFRSDSSAVTLHSILGCVAYGCVVAALWPDRPNPSSATTSVGSWVLLVGATQFIVGVGAATAVVMLFTLQGAASPTQPTEQAQPTAAFDAEQLYEQHCANCHASDGSGGLGSRLAGVVVSRYPNPEDQSAIVALGGNTMPAFAKVLTPGQIEAITTYTRTAWE